MGGMGGLTGGIRDGRWDGIPKLNIDKIDYRGGKPLSDSKALNTKTPDFLRTKTEPDKHLMHLNVNKTIGLDSSISDIAKNGMFFKFESQPTPTKDNPYGRKVDVDARLVFKKDTYHGPNAEIKENTVVNNQVIPAGTEIRVDANGWYMESNGKQSTLLEINGLKYSAITFNYSEDKKSGHVHAGTLSENQMVNGQQFSKGSVVFFDDKGSLDKVTSELKIVTMLPTSKGQSIDFAPGEVEFDKSGKCTRGTLAADTVVNGVKYLKNSEIRFEGNKVYKGTIGNSVNISPELKINKGTIINFKDGGFNIQSTNFLPNKNEPQHKYYAEIEFNGKKLIAQDASYDPKKPDKISIRGLFLNPDGSKIPRAQGDELKKLGIDFDDRALDSQ